MKYNRKNNSGGIIDKLREPKKLISYLTILLIVLAIPVTIISLQNQTSTQNSAAPKTQSCGVYKDTKGDYYFSPLHVGIAGNMRDQNGCKVYLRGVNTIGTEYGTAMGGYISQAQIASLSSQLHTNIWRVSLNASWWNQNLLVPKANMAYQDWIKQLITWIKASGNYVELDSTTYSTIGPCGNGVPYCSQNGAIPPCCTAQDTGNNPQWTETQKVTAAQQMWTSIAQLYANDPAILYDVLNEPTIQNFPNIQQDMNTLISTVRTYSSNAVIVVYSLGYDNIIANQWPDYQQKNLIIDFHFYPTTNWQTRLTTIQSNLTWIKQHSHSVMLGEWGGADDITYSSETPSYNNAIISLAQQNDVGLVYYATTNLIDNNNQLTPNGLLVQPGYLSLPH